MGKIKSFEEIRGIISEIKFKDLYFTLKVMNSMPLPPVIRNIEDPEKVEKLMKELWGMKTHYALSVTLLEDGSEPGILKPVEGRDWLIYAEMSSLEIIKTAYKAVQDIYSEGIKNHFTYKGTAVFTEEEIEKRRTPLLIWELDRRNSEEIKDAVAIISGVGIQIQEAKY